jgi:hypothetical protein
MVVEWLPSLVSLFVQMGTLVDSYKYLRKRDWDCFIKYGYRVAKQNEASSLNHMGLRTS